MSTATRALVTGATGCLGEHLVRALVDAGASVRVLARESSNTETLGTLGVEVQRGSLTEEADLRRAVTGIDTVYHLGGLVIDDPSDTSDALWQEIQRINVDGSELLARLAAGAGVKRFVFASSVRIFGFGNQILWDEDDPRTPSDLYSRGKTMAEAALLGVGAETGLEVVNIRPRFIYGDGDRYILPRFVQQVRRGRVPLPRGGEALCDIVYVKDCVQALMLAAERPVAGKSYNITSGEALSLRDIFEEVARAMDRTIRVIPLPGPVSIATATGVEFGSRALRRTPPLSRAQLKWYMNDHSFSIARARQELGYQPRYRLPEALREIDLQQFVA